MRVVVIGSGLIGLSAAYFLARRAHEVMLVDRQEGPGRETSFANGSLLTPSMPEPWNSPGCWRMLLASLGRSDMPLQLRVRALPSLTRWGMEFLRNSSPQRYRRNATLNLRLACFSLEVLKELSQETQIQYDAAARGTLKLFRTDTALNDALAEAESLRADALPFHRLSRDETIALEPTLAPIAAQIAGAIHYPADASGDAHRFCRALAEHLTQRGVRFAFGTTALRLDVRASRLVGIETDKERLVADQYVVAAGSYSTRLLRPLGLRLPVRPAKGYSVTYEVARGTEAPQVPIVDDAMHAVVVQVGNYIRVAGTAEFAGYDLTLRPERLRNLTRLIAQILPRARLDSATARPWCGLRPMSSDGVPIIGSTSIRDLWICSGHGHLGWTMAAGSGKLLAELMSGATPSLDPAPYSLSRFD